MRRSYTDLTNVIEGWNDCLEPNFLFQSDNDLGIQSEKKSPVTSENVNVEFDSAQNDPNSLIDLYGQYNEIQEFIQLGPYYRTQQQQEEKPQTGKRSAKKQKSGLYSKNYRQKKKEHLKTLQEENIFLKRKVDELQYRLREKEIELNRIKFSSSKDEFNIHKINQEIMKKLTLIAEESSTNTNTNTIVKKQSLTQREQKIAQFLNFYQNDGPGGRKTIELLDYYMNEFLQNMMRDREKYYFMKCLKSEAELKQLSGLDVALMEAFQTSEEDRKKFGVFCKLMRPVCLEVQEACREFYKGYKRVIGALERKHDALKYYMEENRSVEFLKRRLKIILWFQANQYRKEMRNLREEWVQLIKEGDQQSDTLSKEPLKKRNY